MKPRRAAETSATVGRAVDLDPAERRGREVDSRVQGERGELLALGVLDGLGLLLREFAQRAEEILGIAPAEREEAAAAFHQFPGYVRSTR